MPSRIAQLLSFTRTTKADRNDAKISDVKVDAGGGANTTAEHSDGPGADAFPLTTDWVTVADVEGTGRESVSGYQDLINEPKSQKGERRIYGRNPSDGVEVCTVWVKNDGEIEASNENGSNILSPDGSQKGQNASGSFELQVDGNFVVNGVTIDPSGNITSPATITGLNLDGTTSVKAAGKELALHAHLAGTPPGNTGPNI